MTPGPFIDGFDLIALPRARRLARARQRHLVGWLSAAMCSGLLMLGLDSVGALRERSGAQDHGRYRAQLQARVQVLAPAWRDAQRLIALMDEAAARKKALAGLGDRRWALHALLDALARAATPGLALQRLHYHADGQPQWPALPWPSAVDTASRLPHPSLTEAPVSTRPSTSDATTEADRFEMLSDAAPFAVVPHTASLALTVQGIADDDGAVQEWIARLQRDPRVAAVTVDTFVHEPGRPTSLVWGSHTPERTAQPRRSGLTRFRVSVFGRPSTQDTTIIEHAAERAKQEADNAPGSLASGATPLKNDLRVAASHAVFVSGVAR